MDNAVCETSPLEGKTLDEVNAELETLTPEERVAWAIEHLPGEHALSSSFGIQSAIGEVRELGMEHTEIGFALAQKWGLPASLQSVILHHHHPREAAEEHRALCYAVHVGDILAMMAGQGTGADSMQYKLDNDFEQYFHLTQDQLAMTLIEANEEFLELEPVMATAMD